jgi:membrane protease YdiL (CAAX protease family)
MTGDAAPPPEAGAPAPPVGNGPAGSRVFSLEGRPGPGLYLVAWLLAGLGLAVSFIASLAQPPAAGVLLMAGLLMLVGGLSAGAGYQILARATRPQAAYRGPSPLLLFALVFVLVNAIGLALTAVGFGDIETPFGFLVGSLTLFVGYLLAVWLFVVRTGVLSWREMGLPGRESMRSALGDAAMAAGLMLPVTFIALFGGGLVATLLDAVPQSVVPAPATSAETLAVAIAGALLVPISEEVFFRGYALTAWLRDLGPRSALIRSTVFFAVIHVANVQSATFDEGLRQAAVILAVILPLGAVLGWLYLRRGLVGAIVGHMTYNGILLFLQSTIVTPLD